MRSNPDEEPGNEKPGSYFSQWYLTVSTTMDADDFHDFLKQQPFRAFRVTLTDGRAFDVTHSECALVGYSVVEIVFPTVGNRVTIALSHVMQIEYLERR